MEELISLLKIVMNKDGLYPPEEELDEEQEALLKKLYYEEKKMFGWEKFGKIVQERQRSDPSASIVKHIYFDQIRKWLKNQLVHQRFSRPGKRKDSRQIYTSKIGLVQVDAVHMEPWNGFKFIINVIDTYSRKCWAFPVRNLTSSTVSTGLTKLFSEIGTVTVYSTDNGSEFSTDIPGYEHIRSRPHTPQNAGMVESLNGRIRSWLGKAMFADNSKDWVSLLPQIVANYNDCPHDSLRGLTPNHVHSNVDLDLSDMRQNINRVRDKALQVGQLVRIRNNPKTKNKMGKTTFSEKVYTVNKFIEGSNYIRNRYQLKAPSGVLIRTWYNSSELLPIDKVEATPMEERTPSTGTFRRIPAETAAVGEPVEVRRSVREKKPRQGMEDYVM
jgi:integrase-like protein